MIALAYSSKVLVHSQLLLTAPYPLFEPVVRAQWKNKAIWYMVRK